MTIYLSQQEGEPKASLSIWENLKKNTIPNFTHDALLQSIRK